MGPEKIGSCEVPLSAVLASSWAMVDAGRLLAPIATVVLMLRMVWPLDGYVNRRVYSRCERPRSGVGMQAFPPFARSYLPRLQIQSFLVGAVTMHAIGGSQYRAHLGFSWIGCSTTRPPGC